jgi:hypothetical protein
LQKVLHGLAHEHRISLVDADVGNKLQQRRVDLGLVLVGDEVLDDLFEVLLLWVQSYCLQQTPVHSVAQVQVFPREEIAGEQVLAALADARGALRGAEYLVKEQLDVGDHIIELIRRVDDSERELSQFGWVRFVRNVRFESNLG